MGFGKFGAKGGGKKGPRAHNGSFKNKAKLKPQPVQPFQDATQGKRSGGFAHEAFELEQDDADDEDEFGYADDLRGEEKPLAHAIVSVTGCQDVKVALSEITTELGGGHEASLTEKVTHLVADHPGTQKFDVSPEPPSRRRAGRALTGAMARAGCSQIRDADHVQGLASRRPRSVDERTADGL